MFEFDAGKIIIVGVIALIFIPPKDLPRALRQAGQFVGKMRRLAAEFQGQFMDAMREADMADLRQEAHKLSQAARASAGLDSLDDMHHQMTSSLHREQGRSAEPDATAGMARDRSDPGLTAHTGSGPDLMAGPAAARSPGQGQSVGDNGDKAADLDLNARQHA